MMAPTELELRVRHWKVGKGKRMEKDWLLSQEGRARKPSLQCFNTVSPVPTSVSSLHPLTKILHHPASSQKKAGDIPKRHFEKNALIFYYSILL